MAPTYSASDSTVQLVVQAALETYVWTGYTEEAEGEHGPTGGDPLEGLYGIDDFAQPDIDDLTAEVITFLTDHAEDLAATGAGPHEIGHDIVLTRNGHGTGFWDRGYGDPGERLSDAARALGESDAYVGDDGKLYLS